MKPQVLIAAYYFLLSIALCDDSSSPAGLDGAGPFVLEDLDHPEVEGRIPEVTGGGYRRSLQQKTQQCNKFKISLFQQVSSFCSGCVPISKKFQLSRILAIGQTTSKPKGRIKLVSVKKGIAKVQVNIANGWGSYWSPSPLLDYTVRKDSGWSEKTLRTDTFPDNYQMFMEEYVAVSDLCKKCRTNADCGLGLKCIKRKVGKKKFVRKCL